MQYLQQSRRIEQESLEDHWQEKVETWGEMIFDWNKKKKEMVIYINTPTSFLSRFIRRLKSFGRRHYWKICSLSIIIYDDRWYLYSKLSSICSSIISKLFFFKIVLFVQRIIYSRVLFFLSRSYRNSRLVITESELTCVIQSNLIW